MDLRSVVRPSKGRSLDAFLKEWPKRMRKFRSMFAYFVGEFAFREVKARIPRGSEWKEYAQGLTWGQVVGVSPDDDAYAVTARVKAGRMSKVDAPKTLLYVRARRRSRRTPPEIGILESFNPWTAGTLPLTPSPKWAMIVSRKVGKREALKVAQQRQQDEPKWRKALVSAGVRSFKKPSKPSPKMKVLPDILRAAIGLEFGLGTKKSKAHWRPAVIQVKKRAPKAILRAYPQLVQALIDPAFQGWTPWPPPAPERIKMAEARKFEAFQKKLGIKA